MNDTTHEARHWLPSTFLYIFILFFYLLKDHVIILSEDSNIISDQTSVAGILNDFYVNVANDIGTKRTRQWPRAAAEV